MQTARADYFGLEVVERTDLTICQDPSEPDIPFKLEVCEVHVVFDDPTDRLISVAFTNVSTTDPAGFFQHPLNFVNTAPACALIALEPTVECDSFVTLGLECDRGGSTTDPDFDSTKFNNDGEVSGGWYNSAPSNGQGDPDANGRVMIGRFSYKQNKTSSGDVCIFTQDSSGDIVEFFLVPFDCAVPGGGLPASGTIWYVDDDPSATEGCCDDAASCNGWDDACPDLRTVLSLASAGHEIRVAQGTYRPDNGTGSRTLTFQLFDDLTLKGGYAGIGAPNPGARNIEDFETILSGDRLGDDVQDLAGFFECYSGQYGIPSECLPFDLDEDTHITLADANMTENSYHVVSMNGTSNVILDGFTISQGVANLTVIPHRNGAGIYGSGTTSAQLLNCTVQFNYSFCAGAGAVLSGVPLAIPLKIDGCTFDHNLSKHAGGGLFTGGDFEIHNSQFTKNRATDGLFLQGQGGGLMIYATGEFDNALITTSRFTDNEANFGGGVYITARYPEFVSCTFANNKAAQLANGGAVGASRQVDDPSEDLSFTNCLFANHGPVAVAMLCLPGATHAEDGLTSCELPGPLGSQTCNSSQDLELVNCTFYNNGSAIKTDRDVTLKSALIWAGTGVDAPGTCDASYSNIEGGVPSACTDVAGNIGELPAHEPTFSNLAGPDTIPGTSDDDFRTTSGSPGNDAGQNADVPPGVDKDLSGSPRFVDDNGAADCEFFPGTCGSAPIVDMGAYEFQDCGLCPTDVDGDGNTGAFDLAFLLGNWGPIPPDPDPRVLCLDAEPNGVIGAFDLAVLLGSWGPCL